MTSLRVAMPDFVSVSAGMSATDVVLASISRLISQTDFRGVDSSAESLSRTFDAASGFVSDSSKMQSAVLPLSGLHPSGSICLGCKEAGLRALLESRGTSVPVGFSLGLGTGLKLCFTFGIGHLGNGVGATSPPTSVNESIVLLTADGLDDSWFAAAVNDVPLSSAGNVFAAASLELGTDRRRGISGGLVDRSPQSTSDRDSFAPFGGNCGEAQSAETEPGVVDSTSTGREK